MKYYRPECRGCYYWRSMSGFGDKNDYGCHYMLENGHMRKRAENGSCLSRSEKRERNGKRTWPDPGNAARKH